MATIEFDSTKNTSFTVYELVSNVHASLKMLGVMKVIIDFIKNPEHSEYVDTLYFTATGNVRNKMYKMALGLMKPYIKSYNIVDASEPNMLEYTIKLNRDINEEDIHKKYNEITNEKMDVKSPSTSNNIEA